MAAGDLDAAHTATETDHVEVHNNLDLHVLRYGFLPPTELPLTALTDWTAESGVWAADAAGFRQTDKAQAASRIRLNTFGMTAEVIAQVELTINADAAGTHRRAGMLVGHADGVIGAGLVYLSGDGTNITGIAAESDGQVALGSMTLPTAIPYGTFATLRMHFVGGAATITLNGTHLQTAHNLVHETSPIALRKKIGFYTFGTDSSYRNLKIWNRALPA